MTRRVRALMAAAAIFSAVSCVTSSMAQEEVQLPPAAAVAAATPTPAPAAVPAVVVTDDMRAHQRVVDTLYFAGAAYGLVVLIAVLALLPPDARGADRLPHNVQTVGEGRTEPRLTPGRDELNTGLARTFRDEARRKTAVTPWPRPGRLGAIGSCPAGSVRRPRCRRGTRPRALG